MLLMLVIMCCNNIIIIIELFWYLSSNKIETRFMKYFLGELEVKKNVHHLHWNYNTIILLFFTTYHNIKHLNSHTRTMYELKQT